MKNSLACPKCESRKLWRLEAFQVPQPELAPSSRTSATLPVTSRLRRGVTLKTIGHFDAYICHECGYTEFYAQDFEALRPDHSHGIHFIDTTPQRSEYR